MWGLRACQQIQENKRVRMLVRRVHGLGDQHGFVLPIGEPAAGKTTIASLLAMAALDQWNASTLKRDKPEEVKEHWNPDEPSQFFWIDDAFGVSQYESHLIYGWIEG